MSDHDDNDDTVDMDPAATSAPVPATQAQLAGLIEQGVREQNQIDKLPAHEIGRMCGLIAHHSARYSVSYGLILYPGLDKHRHGKAVRRITARVKRDMPQSAIAAFLLQSLISWGIRWFLEWMFRSDRNRTAVSAIGAPLPAWAGKSSHGPTATRDDDED